MTWMKLERLYKAIIFFLYLFRSDGSYIYCIFDMLCLPQGGRVGGWVGSKVGLETA